MVMALGVTMSAAAVPEYLTALDDVRASGAAHHISGRFQRARMEAVMRSATVGVQFVQTTERLQLRRVCGRQPQRRAHARHSARHRRADCRRRAAAGSVHRRRVRRDSRVCRRSMPAARRRAAIRSGWGPATSPASPPIGHVVFRHGLHPRPARRAIRRAHLRRDRQDAHVEVRTEHRDMETAMSDGRPDRRGTRRIETLEEHGIVSACVRPGHRARLIDVSAGGALIETTHRLLPGASVELQVETGTGSRERSRAGAAMRGRQGASDLGLLSRRDRVRPASAVVRRRARGTHLPRRSSEMALEIAESRGVSAFEARAADGIAFGSAAGMTSAYAAAARSPGDARAICWPRSRARSIGAQDVSLMRGAFEAALGQVIPVRTRPPARDRQPLVRPRRLARPGIGRPRRARRGPVVSGVARSDVRSGVPAGRVGFSDAGHCRAPGCAGARDRALAGCSWRAPDCSTRSRHRRDGAAPLIGSTDGDAGAARGDRTRRGDRLHRAARGRERRRQGAGGAADSRA